MLLGLYKKLIKKNNDKWYRDRFTIFFHRMKSKIYLFNNFLFRTNSAMRKWDKFDWEYLCIDLAEFFTNFEYRNGKFIWISKGILGRS